MATRSVRTPLSIKFVVGFYLLNILFRAFGLWNYFRYSGEATPLWAALIGIEAVAILYQLVAAPRLSRWAPIVQVGVLSGFMAWRYVQEPGWTKTYPMLGVFVLIIPTAIYLALVLPHWRKMNWHRWAFATALPRTRPTCSMFRA